jgi:hypothetical protein
MKTLLRFAIALGALGLFAEGAAAHPKPAVVPPAVQVPAGNKLFLVGHAFGVQIYQCNGTAWTFVAPRASLFDRRARFIISHFAGPTWQHRDGSAVVGTVVNNAPVDGAIPLLLLSTKPTASGSFPHTLVKTTFIQRLNTRGGLAPAAATCDATTAGTQKEVPYTADYYFWRQQSST